MDTPPTPPIPAEVMQMAFPPYLEMPMPLYMQHYNGIVRMPFPPKAKPTADTELIRLMKANDAAGLEIYLMGGQHCLKLAMGQGCQKNDSVPKVFGKGFVQSILGELLTPDLTKANQSVYFWAAKQGHICLLRLFLLRDMNVNTQDERGMTALCRAAETDQVETGRFLISRGAKPHISCNDGAAALNIASSWGNLRMVIMLLEEGSDIEFANSEGYTPLHLAASHGKVDVLKYLLEKGADLMATGNDGDTPLIVAAKEGEVEALEILVDKMEEEGEDDGTIDECKYIAAQYGHINVLESLGPDVSDAAIKEHNGRTLLHVAAENGQNEIFEYLYEAEDDCLKALKAVDGDGFTPLDLAEDNGYDELASKIKGDLYDELRISTKSMEKVVQAQKNQIQTLTKQVSDLASASRESFQTRYSREIDDTLGSLGEGVKDAFRKQLNEKLHSALRTAHPEEPLIRVLLEMGADKHAAGTGQDTRNAVELARDLGHKNILVLLDDGAPNADAPVTAVKMKSFVTDPKNRTDQSKWKWKLLMSNNSEVVLAYEEAKLLHPELMIKWFESRLAFGPKPKLSEQLSPSPQ